MFSFVSNFCASYSPHPTKPYHVAEIGALALLLVLLGSQVITTLVFTIQQELEQINVSIQSLLPILIHMASYLEDGGGDQTGAHQGQTNGVASGVEWRIVGAVHLSSNSATCRAKPCLVFTLNGTTIDRRHSPTLPMEIINALATPRLVWPPMLLVNHDNMAGVCANTPVVVMMAATYMAADPLVLSTINNK